MIFADEVDRIASGVRKAMGPTLAQDVEILRLRTQLARLECENAALRKSALGRDFPSGFLGLTPTQIRLLRALFHANGEVVLLERLRALILKPVVSPKLLQVHVCHLRRVLKARAGGGDGVTSHWAEGYSLPPEALEAVRLHLQLSGGNHVARAS